MRYGSKRTAGIMAGSISVTDTHNREASCLVYGVVLCQEQQHFYQLMAFILHFVKHFAYARLARNAEKKQANSR
jgi:hypothetical protein